jgi:hypothetical protein
MTGDSEDRGKYMPDSDCIHPIDMYIIKKTVGECSHRIELRILNTVDSSYY